VAGGSSDIIEISDSDLIARCALFPKFMQSGAFAPEAVVSPFSPMQFEDGTAGFALSVGVRPLLPTTEAAHDFGCRVAKVANEDRAVREQRELKRPDETVHYRGFYDLKVGDVSSVPSDHFDLGVVHHPENGLQEHGHIELRLKDPALSKTKQRTYRTGVIAQIAMLLLNPQEHICPCDEDLREMLSAVNLPAPPF